MDCQHVRTETSGLRSSNTLPVVTCQRGLTVQGCVTSPFCSLHHTVNNCVLTTSGLRPSNSSPVVTRLLEAHGIVLGKTNMEELAEGLTTINPVYGPVLNPYNNLYDVGGKAVRFRLSCLCCHYSCTQSVPALACSP